MNRVHVQTWLCQCWVDNVFQISNQSIIEVKSYALSKLNAWYYSEWTSWPSFGNCFATKGPAHSPLTSFQYITLRMYNFLWGHSIELKIEVKTNDLFMLKISFIPCLVDKFMASKSYKILTDCIHFFIYCRRRAFSRGYLRNLSWPWFCISSSPLWIPWLKAITNGSIRSLLRQKKWTRFTSHDKLASSMCETLLVNNLNGIHLKMFYTTESLMNLL